jgi:hypothetical protein
MTILDGIFRSSLAIGRVVLAAASAACLVLITACGTENTDSSADQPGHSSGGSPTTSTTQSVKATVVTVHRTGGIAGVNDSWTVRTDKPGDLSPRSAAAVLRIASSPAFMRIDATRPTRVCCDFFSYVVTVQYSDGSQLQLQTDDGSPRPAPLTQLLALFA